MTTTSNLNASESTILSMVLAHRAHYATETGPLPMSPGDIRSFITSLATSLRFHDPVNVEKIARHNETMQGAKMF